MIKQLQLNVAQVNMQGMRSCTKISSMDDKNTSAYNKGPGPPYYSTTMTLKYDH